jgi:positive regulator of sigma E activity
VKPEIPETGRVIRLDKERAFILLRPTKSCKGCGAAAIGLCRPNGGLSTITAKNEINAAVGDMVKVTLDRDTRRRGFFLAYLLPLACFLGGSIIGYVVDARFSLRSFDVIGGFASLLLSAFFSLRRLSRLDKSTSLMVKEIIS